VGPTLDITVIAAKGGPAGIGFQQRAGRVHHAFFYTVVPSDLLLLLLLLVVLLWWWKHLQLYFRVKAGGRRPHSCSCSSRPIHPY
jgi:hypothetical protein